MQVIFPAAKPLVNDVLYLSLKVFSLKILGNFINLIMS